MGMKVVYKVESKLQEPPFPPRVAGCDDDDDGVKPLFTQLQL